MTKDEKYTDELFDLVSGNEGILKFRSQEDITNQKLDWIRNLIDNQSGGGGDEL